MKFEEWFDKQQYGISRYCFEYSAMKAAYRAGLLHAAEQDDKEANKYVEASDGRSWLSDSAAMHRQSAEEVK